MVVRFYRYIVGFLVLGAFSVWIALGEIPDSNFRIIACDVGQGDAILAVYKDIQILTDGGANNRVLDCLSRYLPFWDREIELVILTHPEKDHYTGLIEIFRRYKVDNFLYNQGTSSSQGYEALEKEVGRGDVTLITPDVGKSIRVGLIYLDVLRPSQNFQSKKTNDYSIVSLVKFREFEALLTGDIENVISDSLSGVEQVDYIKIPHHGSKNGLSENLLKAAMPKIAVISVGKNNSYGHPHEEILKMLENYNVKILRTDEMGDVVIETDGEKIWLP